jgi:hypothetical protein
MAKAKAKAKSVPATTTVEINGASYPAMRVADLRSRRADYNPRRISDHDRAALQRSIGRFGVVQPVVFNSRSDTIVGGHQRLDAAAAEGIELFPVMVVDLSHAEERALNLSLNRVGGDFDWEGVATVLRDLADSPECKEDGDFMDLAGFTASEIEPLLTAEFSTDGVVELPDDLSLAVEKAVDRVNAGTIAFDEFVELARAFIDSPEPASMSGEREEERAAFHDLIRSAVEGYDDAVGDP